MGEDWNVRLDVDYRNSARSYKVTATVGDYEVCAVADSERDALVIVCRMIAAKLAGGKPLDEID